MFVLSALLREGFRLILWWRDVAQWGLCFYFQLLCRIDYSLCLIFCFCLFCQMLWGDDHFMARTETLFLDFLILSDLLENCVCYQGYIDLGLFSCLSLNLFHLWLKVNYLYRNLDFESKVMIIFCCSSRKFHYWYALTTNLNLFFVAYKLLYSQLLSFHL